MNKNINLQDVFLNQVRKEHIPVTVYLTNGFQLRGMVRVLTISPLSSTAKENSSLCTNMPYLPYLR